MVSAKPPHNANSSSAPLADYFFIASIESSQIFDQKLAATLAASTASVEDTIQEHSILDTTNNGRPISSEGLNGVDTPKRRSRLSYEARKSVTSMLASGSASNRSSATIRAINFAEPFSCEPKGLQLTDQGGPVGPIGGSGLSDEDFDTALKKFANERDTFLEEIHFSAGTLPELNSKPKRSAKTQKIVNEDVGGLRSGVGSLRRRISTMNSLKRQPSVMRQCKRWSSLSCHVSSDTLLTCCTASIRTSKRMSGYNSVIPNPQPFHLEPKMHPLKRRYEPVLLDRYPPKDMVSELKRRNPFPDFVPMFAFPNDITVVSSDERPKSTWHGFAMTTGDASKLYGITLIVWTPLNVTAAEELERQCDAWRKANMSGEERELASSLGERLAIERAKLSRLLASLPSILQGSDEREQLEDDISAVEEKIGLMTDLLRPVRHGAASKIEGLTDGETGLWIPRAYGVLGRDVSLTGFWKEWLRAVCVPMTNGTVLRVPATSPKVGLWQPLERYVVNLCAEALSPISSITQVEVQIRELRLYARKEAVNELPGTRNIDLYPLFKALSIPNIVTLFEYLLAESRIILVSSHTAMLHLVSHALVALMYPLEWTGVFVPVLPSRLIQTLEAPVPYIVGIERRYENYEFPEDDFVLVDLDKNVIESTAQPTSLPRQLRRKLVSLLQVAAPHQNRYGVELGAPAYAKETYPNDAFSSEYASLYNHRPTSSTLATLVSLNSASFNDIGSIMASTRSLVFNAFLQARNASSRGSDHRPATSSTGSTTRIASPPSPPRISPISTQFPTDRVSRSDSGYALQAGLREKRSAHFDQNPRRSSSVSVIPFAFKPSGADTRGKFGFDRMATMRRPSQPSQPSQPFLGHASTLSTSTLNSHTGGSSYAPSVYAQSTLAASTIMPGMLMQPVRNTSSTQWVEGHCMQFRPHDERTTCTICDETSDEGIYKCNGRCLDCHER